MSSKLLTTNQACEKLGIHINTLYRYINEDKIKAHKMGGYEKHRRWRIREKNIEKFIEQEEDNEVYAGRS